MISPVPGKPGVFINRYVRWVKPLYLLDLDRFERLATPEEEKRARNQWMLDVHLLRAAMHSDTRRRRSRGWRRQRRERGRQYSRLIRFGPSRKRPCLLYVEYTLRLGEWRETQVWDTVALA